MNTDDEKSHCQRLGDWPGTINIGLVFLSVALPFLAKCWCSFVAHRIILQNAKIRQGYCVAMMEQDKNKPT